MVSLPILELIRLEESEQGTLGVLKVNKELFCATLEPPDRLNLVGRSNIPPQQYYCYSREYVRGGYLTYEVVDVPGRSAILFHKGNTVHDTEGCIILGQYWSRFRGNRAVLNSGATFTLFMSMLTGNEKLHLTIKEDY